MLINLFNKSYIGGKKNETKKKHKTIKNHEAIKNHEMIKNYNNDKKYISNYVSEYMSEYYNDNIIKKRIIYILNNSDKRSHNKNLGDIVVDTLNIIYFIYNYHNYSVITNDTICIGIEYITKKLKKYFPGRIMFIIKDKNTLLNNSKIRDKYKELSKKLKIYIYIAEKYNSHNAPSWKKPTWVKSSGESADIHSTESRDDLAAILLSKKYKCPILSNDNYSDNYEYRATIPPFKLLEYNWYSSIIPLVESYKPENLQKFSTIPNIKIKLENIFINGEAEAIKLL
jgi:hypothetical protein